MRVSRRTCLRVLVAGTLLSACSTGPQPGALPYLGTPSPATTPRVDTSRVTPPEVRVERQGSAFSLTLGGEVLPIRGMGYNVLYQQRGLGGTEREERLRDDFALLRSIGVNTIQSWEAPEVDRLHLDLAYQYKLSVIPYFDLSKKADYSDPKVQEHYRYGVEHWLRQWQSHPAILMWGIGNEVLLAATQEQAEAFAAFYPSLVAIARRIDPTRPVIYREAEDVWVPVLRDGFDAAGGTPDQFVYGLNFYTPRLADVLDNWDQHQWDVPLVVSEFAPTGVPLDERPDGFRRLWDVLVAHHKRVLGGAVYTWTTEGPEATDHIFGLVNDQSQPLDASLMVLSELWGGTYGQPLAAQVRVPDLTGQLESEARSIAYATGLLLQTVQSRSLPQLPATVRSQRPRPGRMVARRATVRIVVPPHPAEPANEAALDRLFAQARDAGLQVSGESEQQFERTRAAAADETVQSLGAQARTDLDRQRAQQLAAWQGWIVALASLETPDDDVFPGATNIIPVFAGLSRYAMQDSRAFAQAENFARSAVAEWIAAVGA